ncbi:fam-f protein [Plasmodium gallinaceum]|uniref:Fam-f protein n=1 Tax=Plasmodium gallinaceum TaxID=5849 RepID=A0A1J1GPP0_PLAGA|nr:fam-f protein [Plasmodium gallinaceum]CRG94475.1 fam-f protein [Plasmodium gallinaceum]
MKIHLFLLYDFYFLITIVVYIYLSCIDPYYNSKKYKLKFIRHTEIQLVRNFAELYDFKDKDIINSLGLSMKDVQLLYNTKEAKYENTLAEGYFGDSRNLFVKLIDTIFLKNYYKCLEKEKKHIRSIYNTLETTNYEVLNFLKSSVNDAEDHINTVFQRLISSDKSQLLRFNDIEITLRQNGDNFDLLINEQDAHEYLEQLIFSGEIPLRLENSFNYFSKLNEKNDIFISKLSNGIFSYLFYTTDYFNLRKNMFPLKYINGHDSDIIDYYRYEMKYIFKIFTNSIFLLNKKRSTTIICIKENVNEFNDLFNNINRALDRTIEDKTHKLFMVLNKILNGDIKCIISFISYILEVNLSKNKFKLDKMRNKYNNICQHKILNYINDLFLQEKEEIKESLVEFKTYIKDIFGFYVNSTGIRSLVSKLYGSVDIKSLEKIFKVIVFSLLCKKQINEYADFIQLLKNESKNRRIDKKKFIGTHRRINEKVLFIPKNKSENLILKYAEIYERNNFINNINCCMDLPSALLDLEEGIHKFFIFRFLIYSLNNELNKSEKHYFSSKKKKLLNKNVILYFLYDIMNFNSSYEKKYKYKYKYTYIYRFMLNKIVF